MPSALSNNASKTGVHVPSLSLSLTLSLSLSLSLSSVFLLNWSAAAAAAALTNHVVLYIVNRCRGLRERGRKVKMTSLTVNKNTVY